MLKALMKSMRLIVVLLLSLVLAKRVFADSPFLPEPLEKCLKPSSLQVQVTLVLTRNPFYLRGDFDADGRPDYAVVVRVKETGKEALVICRSAGRAVLLGGRADAKQAFSSNEGDDFVAKNWGSAHGGRGSQADIVCEQRSEAVAKPSGRCDCDDF